MKSLIKNFLYNSIYQIFTLIVPLITTPYVSRALGPEGVGIYSYRYSIVSYFMIFILLGLNNYGNRAIARLRDDPEKLRKEFWSIYLMQLSLGIIVLLLYSVYGFFLAEERVATLIMGGYVLSSVFDINWFFFGLEKFKLIVLRNCVIRIISTGAIFLLVKTRNSVYVYCLILCASTLCSQLALWPYVFKNVKPIKVNIRDVIRHVRPNLVLFLTVIAVSLFKTMDKIMLGAMTNNVQVGFYELSERVINVPIALITSLGTVMLPRMSNIVARGENGSQPIIHRSLLIAMFISTSLSFGIMAVSKEFVPLFYGAGYTTCVHLYLLLLPSCIFLAFANVIRTQYLLPNQMDRAYVTSAFLGAGANIIINGLLIPARASEGAAIGTLCAEAVVCIYQSLKVQKYLPVRRYALDCLPFVISGTVMFTVIFFIRFDLPVITCMVIKIALGAVVYFTALLLQLTLIMRIRAVEVKSVIQYLFHGSVIEDL